MKKKPDTNDLIIRLALLEFIKQSAAPDDRTLIIEELGVQHGTARVDIAVVNGIFHGYEIKSDQDTLRRLPEQMEAFNAVFDKMTLVVGKNHLYEAVKMVPDWWGIIVAKVNIDASIILASIREEGVNRRQDGVSIARLLWREEALKILEQEGEAKGFYSKPRELIYHKLSEVLDTRTLSDTVREVLSLRADWRPDAPLMLNGG